MSLTFFTNTIFSLKKNRAFPSKRYLINNKISYMSTYIMENIIVQIS